MESKYKDRAIELFHRNSKMTCILGGMEEYCDKDQAVKAMCQLAEEVESIVEKERQRRIAEFLTPDTVESMLKSIETAKKEVEELLRKQRELCAEKVKFVYKTDTSFVIDKESILNAKLKID